MGNSWCGRSLCLGALAAVAMELASYVVEGSRRGSWPKNGYCRQQPEKERLHRPGFSKAACRPQGGGSSMMFAVMASSRSLARGGESSSFFFFWELGVCGLARQATPSACAHCRYYWPRGERLSSSSSSVLFSYRAIFDLCGNRQSSSVEIFLNYVRKRIVMIRQPRIAGSRFSLPVSFDQSRRRTGSRKEKIGGGQTTKQRRSQQQHDDALCCRRRRNPAVALVLALSAR